MFEEPFRWMEAISTRHSYVREKLGKGQPVIGVPYNEGAVILGFSPQPGKIFEIYDRIALGGLGHPADVERLRMTLLDMAHVEGFNRSAQDVTIARLLQFGLAPALKQNFEEIQRAPYLIQMLLTEINREGGAEFFRVNYDGYWETFKKGTVIAGDSKVCERIQKEIDNTDFASLSLDKALQSALRLWEEGRKKVESEKDAESSSDDDDQDEEESEKLPATLKEAFDRWNLEAAVLSRNTQRKCLYRSLTEQEISTLESAVTQ
ncbi:MAG: proteasome subunit alpha [Nitrospinaceae bacterium]|nr:proteasome subunit alpha [Nitrospinaceae bacterium]